MSFVQTNLPCDDCGSSDARAIDENGWSKCFSCGQNRPINQVEERINMGALVLNEDYDASEGVIYRDLKDRKISVNAMEKYGVGFRGNDIVFPYGERKAAKVRAGGKKEFKIEGDWKSASTLFGQEQFSNNDKL